jgi:kynureninase
MPRFAGWWGHDEKERFLMKRQFRPIKGAQGWQLSNAQILPMAVHRASLEIFDQAGMPNLRKKSVMLTAYLEFILGEVSKKGLQFELITPKNPQDRGCQLSVLVKENGKGLFDYLKSNGVIADWREPDVIRMAPVPLYNKFEEIYQLGQLIEAF